MQLKWHTLLHTAVLICLPTWALAGGPFYISLSGEISHWNELVMYTEAGSCGPLTNAETIALVQDAILAWHDLAEVDFDYSITQGELPDINASNYLEYVITEEDDPTNTENNSDNITPIIFDDDGGITEALMGTDGQFSFVGLTSLNNFSDTDLEFFSEGQVILNCRCLATHPTLGSCDDVHIGSEVSLEEFESVVVHELGHLLNLDHSLANEDTDLPATMYPYVFDDPTPFEVTQDDITALAQIYPATNFADDYCFATGTLIDRAGDELRCANVVATSDNEADTVTFVSGALSARFAVASTGEITQADECTENCGDFQFYLTPNTSYTLSITPIAANFTDGAGLGPCRANQDENITAQANIATIAATTCTAGASLDLGRIRITGANASTSSTCSLNTLAVQTAHTQKTSYAVTIISLCLLFLLRFKGRFVKLADLR